MAGYNDTKDLIIRALMGRPAGTEIQPENHQAYALNMLDYIRSVELVSTSTLIGIAEENTVPIQPNDSRVCYIAGVGQDRTVTFSNFIDDEGNPISITTGEMEGVFVILLWNMEHWVAYTFNTNIISSAESANFYYGYNIRKTYASVAAMNADSVNPIGTDGRLIKIGELVTVVNSTTPSENGYYSYEGSENGWSFQSGFSFEIVQTTGTDINKVMSQKAVTDEIAQLANEVTSFHVVNEDYVKATINSGIVTFYANPIIFNSRTGKRRLLFASEVTYPKTLTVGPSETLCVSMAEFDSGGNYLTSIGEDKIQTIAWGNSLNGYIPIIGRAGGLMSVGIIKPMIELERLNTSLTSEINDISSSLEHLDNRVFSVKSKNLFDKSDVLLNTKMDATTGKLTTVAGYVTSKPISVTPGLPYVRSNWALGYPYVRFLDVNGNILKPRDENGIEFASFNVSPKETPVYAPPTATHIQFLLSTPSSGLNWEDAQLEQNTVATSYAPYGGKINANDIAGLGGGEGIFTEIVVAASDADAKIKLNADYVCDGVDDEVEINQAIAEIAALGGGQIYLPKGNYIVSEQIKVKNNCSLKGSGWSTVVKLANNVNFGFVDEGAGIIDVYALIRNESDGDSIQVHDLKIDGNRANNTGGQYHSLFFKNGINCVANNLFVIGGFGSRGGCGIVDSAGNRTTISNCITTGSARHGIATTSFTQNFIITNNQSYLNNQSGIHTSTGMGVVSNNMCYKNNTDGIQGTNASESIYIGNVCYENGSDGINAVGGHKIIANNTISNNGAHGIDLTHTGGGVSNIQIVGNKITGNALNAIYGTAVFDIIIKGNNIKGSATSNYGIRFEQYLSGGHFIISDNMIKGGLTKAISMDAGYDNIIISGNVALSGIEIDANAVNVIEVNNMIV